MGVLMPDHEKLGHGGRRYSYRELRMDRRMSWFVWKRQDLFAFSSCVMISILITFLPLPQVSIKFSKEQDLPGSTTRLRLQAAPDSFCALRAVDKSVLLLKPEQELSPDMVSTLVPQCPWAGWMHALPFAGYLYLWWDFLKASVFASVLLPQLLA